MLVLKSRPVASSDVSHELVVASTTMTHVNKKVSIGGRKSLWWTVPSMARAHVHQIGQCAEELSEWGFPGQQDLRSYQGS